MSEETDTSNTYDLILIGSGIGSMTVASLMAQLRGKRVLVLERHFRAGGFTHSFERGRFSWDVGVHYVGDMAPGGQLRRLFDLIADGQVVWNRMPEPFDVFVYPDIRFEHRYGRANFIKDLSGHFPEERGAIREYVNDVYRAATAFGMSVMARQGAAAGRWVARIGRALNRSSFDQTTGAYLDSHFKDPKLKAVLASQWGDYGLPPALSPFPLHSLIVKHYLDGAWYPEGGSGTIAPAVKALVESAGGRFLLSREVTEVVVENGRATGVVARNGRGEVETYRAPVVISGVGAALTYLKLVPERCDIPFREPLRHFVAENPPTSHVSLYVGFKDDPRKLGFRGENHWIFKGYDHDAVYARRAEWVGDGDPDEVYLSFPSLKQNSARGHTAELISFADFSSFNRWREQPWRRRDAEYAALKEKIADGLVRFVQQRYPGFAELIEYRELSTPLTNEFMTGYMMGAIYGLHAVPARFRSANHAWTDAVTPIEGLYLTGADVASLGVAGAIMGGVTTLSFLPDGVSLLAAFRAAPKKSSDDE